MGEYPPWKKNTQMNVGQFSVYQNTQSNMQT